MARLLFVFRVTSKSFIVFKVHIQIQGFWGRYSSKTRAIFGKQKKCVINFLSPKKYFLVTLRPSAIFKNFFFALR